MKEARDPLQLILVCQITSSAVIQYMKESLAHKLRRERVEACLNCKKFVKCDSIGKFEECVDFQEVEGDAWTIKKLDNY
jgi:hypothetical protein